MHAGTVVVASQTSSHPEVIGDAGLMFDPYDVEDMSKVLLNLINNPELKKELIKKGFENVKRFGWDKTANQALEIIKQVNASNN
jgi:glycosyltransferase involved in cell wall biosynthesis